MKIIFFDTSLFFYNFLIFLAEAGIELDQFGQCFFEGGQKLNSSDYFNPLEPEWQRILGVVDDQQCPGLDSSEFSTIRSCARAHFYGPDGAKRMMASGTLHSAQRNDMVLVLISGCVQCAVGDGLDTDKGPLKISLVKHHPEGSFFSTCREEWQTLSTIELDLLRYGQVVEYPANALSPTRASIPFIIGAIFYERRCHGLFSSDAFRMYHRSHYLLLENVHCGKWGTMKREIPLADIDVDSFPERALETVFVKPLDLNDPTRSFRASITWGMKENEIDTVGISKFPTDIDCGRVMKNDKEYIKERAAKRLKYTSSDEDLPMDCHSLNVRHNYFRPPKNLSQEERDFPIAFVRLVFKDYKLLENELAVHYLRHNFYCYAIDRKSSRLFHRQINSLASCLKDNVFVVKRNEELEMDSGGHNFIISLMTCVKMLSKPQYNWKYIVLLQNHDVQTKTNQEMVQIFKWFNGVSDIQYVHIGSTHVKFEGYNWTLAHLRLFRNVSKNQERNATGQLRELKKNKGYSCLSLSRPFVDWLLNTLNIDPFLDQLNSFRYAGDEYVFPTLGANEFLEAPGGFTGKCFVEKQLAPGMTRFNLWSHVFPKRCFSKNIRHSICILSLEELVPYMANMSFLFANKMMPEYDAEAIQCWHEVMHNRSHLERGLHRLPREEFYTELPQIRYNRDKVKKDFNLTTFDCCYKFLDDVRIGQEWNVRNDSCLAKWKSNSTNITSMKTSRSANNVTLTMPTTTISPTTISPLIIP